MGHEVGCDYLGNALTVDRDATRAAIDDFVGGFLCYETRAARIIAAAAADSGNCLANAYAGMIFMLLEAPGGQRAHRDLSPMRERQRAAPRDASSSMSNLWRGGRQTTLPAH